MEASAVMYWYTGTGGWGTGLAMGLIWLVFWGALVTWIVLLVRRPTRTTPRTDTTPERILAERFARGEIDHDEHTNRLAVLHEAQRPREQVRS